MFYKYYIELCEKGFDEPYAIQTEVFPSKQKAISFYNKYFTFVDERFVAYVMTMRSQTSDFECYDIIKSEVIR